MLKLQSANLNFMNFRKFRLKLVNFLKLQEQSLSSSVRFWDVLYMLADSSNEVLECTVTLFEVGLKFKLSGTSDEVDEL